jgi:TorA maturation chaperone TorD
MRRIEASQSLDWETILVGEMLLFGMLGKIFYTYPELDWLHSLAEQEVFSETPLESQQPDIKSGLKLLQSWSVQNRERISDEHFKDLKADYTHLFIGLDEVLAPPWESVYFNKDRMVFQEQTLQVRNWYRRFGLEPEKLHKEPDDHIGLELSFISYLSKLSLQALEGKDEERFKMLLEAQRQFISEHPMNWAPAWCDLVIKHACTDFYRGAALILRGALIELKSILTI